eukprot:CAMPEP_0114622820 /NCGR_PEP_ID=MMETSP0168-20121206/9932_1 /TAXON_ID=95228 ORGANISM="Vannella sp., Strain DIVA3 517/6/12" /NCGR_SAMPLE_ID=MMETSP0168 /ASSEMBLY_ACC=CAM_ASM_000044 /LENGTH=133 /DNA_ID=CAMNT_0001834043 /DNA_START=197 /DNA_END=595 /DNA_ORIENTATION=+
MSSVTVFGRELLNCGGSNAAEGLLVDELLRACFFTGAPASDVELAVANSLDAAKGGGREEPPRLGGGKPLPPSGLPPSFRFRFLFFCFFCSSAPAAEVTVSASFAAGTGAGWVVVGAASAAVGCWETGGAAST